MFKGEEGWLRGGTTAIIKLASTYGRYGYRRITALLRRDVGHVDHKRVARIWQREVLQGLVSLLLRRRRRLGWQTQRHDRSTVRPMVGGDDDPERDIAAVDVRGRNDALHHGLETLVFDGCGDPSAVRCLRIKWHSASDRCPGGAGLILWVYNSCL